MSNNGKKTVYVDSNNYAETVQRENFNKNSFVSQIPDQIRYYSSNFWTNIKNQLKLSDVGGLFSISKRENYYVLTADKTKFFENVFENGLIKEKFNKSAWELFVEQKMPQENQIFEDFYFLFPESTEIADVTAKETKDINYFNREFIYNFFSPYYEKLTSDQFFDVTTLPTIYNVLNNKIQQKRGQQENLALSLGGLIDVNYVDSLMASNKTTDYLKEYFVQYSQIYNRPEVVPVLEQIKDFNSLVIYSSSNLTNIKKLNNKYVPFPFYSSIEFSNLVNNKNAFIHDLKAINNLDSDLLNFVTTQFSFNQKKYIFSKDNNPTEEVSLNNFNLKTWINANIDVTNEGDFSLTANNTIKYTELLEYIKKNLKQKFRDYDKLTSEPSYYEVLFYKIDKRQFNHEKNNKPINSVFITPDSGDVIKYIDTQIKYGTKYYYTISAFTLVIGTEYKYKKYYSEQINTEKNYDIENGLYKFNVETKASYKVFEVPVAKFNGAVFEKPYTKPVINIKQQDNNLVFLLENSDIRNFEKFEILDNRDFNLFESIRTSQQNEDPDTIESLLGNNSINKLQIFRTVNYPENYLAFNGKLYKTLILDNNKKSFIDNIVPNIKYYYVFRYLNEHDIPSNTSKIYEIILKDEDGYQYLETKIIDLNMSSPRQKTKGMKKYLLIRPSLLQTQPKFNKDIQTVQDIELGPKINNLWGIDKKFLLRIKSNKSNRVLDFYITSTIKRKNST